MLFGGKRARGKTVVILADFWTLRGSSARSNAAADDERDHSPGVTEIHWSAFGGCSGLTSVTIPSSVTSIGDGAFGGCHRLRSITISAGVTSISDAAFTVVKGVKATVCESPGRRLPSIVRSLPSSTSIAAYARVPKNVTRTSLNTPETLSIQH